MAHKPNTSPKISSLKTEAARLLRRLYKLMTRQLDMIEARHQKKCQKGGVPMTLADSEKEVRTLGNLTKQLEKMIELENCLQGRGKGEGGNESTNTEQLRNSLTRRLAKFGGPSSGGKPGIDNGA